MNNEHEREQNMEFIPALDSFSQDEAAKLIWERLSGILGDVDGICYYKHPIISSVSSLPPDFALIAEGYEPVAIKSVSCTLGEIESIGQSVWKISGQESDSPLLILDDFVTGLKNKFERQRPLRRLLNPIGILALPLIGRKEFERKFKNIETLMTSLNGWNPNTHQLLKKKCCWSVCGASLLY